MRSEDDLQALAASGDVAHYPADGSYRWTVGNSQGKRAGSLARRGPKAAPLFDPQSGGMARSEQLARSQEASRLAFISAIATMFDRPASSLTFEEARMLYHRDMIAKVAAAPIKSRIDAERYLDEAMGLTPTKQPAAVAAVQINLNLEDVDQRRLQHDIIEAKNKTKPGM